MHNTAAALRRPRTAIALTAMAAVVLPYLYGSLCELVRDGRPAYTLAYLEKYWVQLSFGAVVTALLFLFVTLLTARPWAGSLATGGVLCAAAWVSLQKLTYRGDPLLPKDLFAAGAAANIAQHMHLTVSAATWVFIAAVALCTLLLLPVRLPLAAWARARRHPRAARIGLALAPLAALALYFGTVLYNEPLMLRYGIYLSRVSFADTYYRGTFVTSFCTQTASLFPMKAPEGYSEQGVAQAVALLAPETDARGEQRRCDVFVVLLESYFFLDNYDTAEISEPLTENFDRLKAEGISGQMLSTGYGGGTANIEFSVLSGYFTNFLPAGSFPYMEYVKDGFLCYPQFLKACGYRTLAVHPYTRTYYNRNAAYPAMGFDLFVSEEGFSAADRVGEYTGEQATLDKALALYREAAADGPVFVHVVTMQNHGPNKPGKYAPGYAVQAATPEADAAHNASLTSIATGLRDIDAAIGAFCDALRGEERDAVVLFFGDHQASVNGSGGYDGHDLLGDIASYAALPPEEQALRSHITPYLMWANFATGHEGEDAGLLPSHMLLPVMLNAYDVLRPAWFDWLLATEPSLGGLDYDLYFTDAASLAGKMTPQQQEVYRAEELLQYDLMFGGQYAAEALYGTP